MRDYDFNKMKRGPIELMVVEPEKKWVSGRLVAIPVETVDRSKKTFISYVPERGDYLMISAGKSFVDKVGGIVLLHGEGFDTEIRAYKETSENGSYLKKIFEEKKN